MSEAWIVVFDMQSTLLSSGILLIPTRWPVFGNADLKFVAGTYQSSREISFSVGVFVAFDQQFGGWHFL